MAFENEMNEYNQLPSYPNEKDPYGSSEYWTIDRVLRWLEVNDFKPAIEVFKGNI
jgi:hypothetical protein